MADQPQHETPSQTMNRLIRETPTKAAHKADVRAAFLASVRRTTKGDNQ